jgi:acyl-CoA synthetase (AMP-forming)/AMP-acid ligase II
MLGEMPSLNVVESISLHAKFKGNRTALICGEHRLDWTDFNASVNAIASALIDEGLKKGDKVALLSLNSIDAVGVIFGVMRAGGVVVPLCALLTPQQLASFIEDSGSEFIFCDAQLQALVTPVLTQIRIPAQRRIALGFSGEGWRELSEFIVGSNTKSPYPQLSDDDEANIMYSSGTTGVPKGIVHDHRARFLTAMALAAELNIDSSAVTLLTTPLFSNATWAVLLPTVFMGGATSMLVRFTPDDFLDAVERERVSHTLMVPIQVQSVLASEGLQSSDTASLRIVVTVGSAMPLAIKELFLKTLGNRLVDLYGVTEGVGTILKPEEMRKKIGSVGTPILDADLRIINEAGHEVETGEIGEIVGYGGGLMKHYHHQPQATKDAIWRDERGRSFFRTGDMGRFDEDGYLYILDRKKDMIISGGLNVFAVDIEAILVQHPAVAEACVIAIPNTKWGESPLALIVRKSGATTDEEEIRDWANAQLAKHQRIFAVKFREELPRNAIGKVLKKVLRELYST